MSAEAVDGEVISRVGNLRDTLIAMGKLTLEDAVRIDDVMRTVGFDFGEAAIKLGFVTQENIEEALRAGRHSPPKSPAGVIEGALHKGSFTRNLPVKYVRMVKPGQSLVLAHRPDESYSEQIRALRTELLLLNSASRNGNLLVILSPCRGDGRTQLCAELAIAFSQLGQRTLLVDADLRRPRIHELFQSDLPYTGLGQALASGDFPELFSVDTLPHLSVLLSGPSVPNPLESLTNGQFQKHIPDWRKQYAVIIVDTPPITEFADGLAIASFAEQVLIVGRSGSTPHKNIKEMLRRMGSTQSRIVGSVINSF